GTFEDGLVFAMPECDPLPPDRDLRELFSPLTESLSISLAVPRRQSTTGNCDLDGGSAATRYPAVNRPIRDVYDGIDERDVKLCEKNIRLVIDSEIDDGMLTIPLARVQRDGSGQLIYDAGFIPPCTKLTASDRLMSFVGQMVEVFEEKRKALMMPR